MNRRQLIKTLFSAFLVGGVTSTFVVSINSSQDIRVLKSAYEKWITVSGIEPDQFLIQRLASTDAEGEAALAILIKEDFSRLQTFELDGYLFSATEAALIAIGGHWALKRELV